MAKRAIYLSVALIAGLLMLAPVAQASSFTFGGNSDGTGVHLHSQGRINFQWVPVTGSSGDASDPVNSLYWGSNDLDIFAVIGKTWGSYSLTAGTTFSGLDYLWAAQWLDGSNLPKINSQEQDASYTTWDFTGVMHISTVTFTTENSIILTGSVTDMINKLTASAVLTDLAASPGVDFTINIVSSEKSTDLLAALNSGALSSWANINGVIGGPGAPVVPEPGTLALMGSALASGGFFWRRRARKEEPEQA